MTPIERTNTKAKSADLIKANIEVLKSLFPEAVSEGKVDITVLKDLLGQTLLPDEERDEKYGLNWFGKRKARQIALTPSTGTLRPCKEDSVDWDTTKNLMIEGDNLEVLKLLQKSYAGQVKLIYIDPPYNTGKDFVYPDNFQDNIKNYLELTGQIEGKAKMEANTESSGRFHTDWLTMMLPRLKLARNLLSDDGAIICSIGDEEVANLTTLMSEVFGYENFSSHFCIIRSEGGGLAKQVIKGHDFLLVYAKNIALFKPLRRPRDIRGEVVDIEGDEYWIEEDWLRKEFGSYGTCEYHEIEQYHGLSKKNEIDAGLVTGIYKLIKKRNGAVIVGRLRKVEDDSSKFYSVQKHLNANATNDIIEIGLNVDFFSYPKPLSLITDLVLGATYFSKKDEDIILDFFAGSGTTGHAVMQKNLEDGGNRRFILVQLPEPLDPDNKDQKAAVEYCTALGKPKNIAELTKERLRRAGKKIKEGNPKFSGDLGFRVFKLDTSNILPWEPEWDKLDEILRKSTDHVKAGRSEADILYELLLKLGLDLAVPIEEKLIASKKVYSIGAGTLLVCLDKNIGRADADPLALGIVTWHKELAPVGETTCVFLDSGFADDVTKTNLSAILNQHGLGNVRSL